MKELRVDPVQDRILKKLEWSIQWKILEVNSNEQINPMEDLDRSIQWKSRLILYIMGRVSEN